MTFSEVIDAFEEAKIDIRGIYWTPSLSPDFEIVYEALDLKFRVEKVELKDDVIVVSVVPV